MDASDQDNWTIHDVKRGVQLIEVKKSWRDFVDFIDKKHANVSVYVFRGQPDASWQVESTLDRLEQRFIKKQVSPEGVEYVSQGPRVMRHTHLQRFKEIVRGRRGPNPPQLSNNDEWWALAQHHGLATPMLDWTYSPFVALFFAFEEEKVLAADGQAYVEPAKRAVFGVDSASIMRYQKNHIGATAMFSPQGETSYRLINQRGLFMRMPPRKDLEGWVKTHFSKETKSKRNTQPSAVIQKITVPSTGKDRRECLKFLDKMNINRASLFPDLDGAARYINSLLEPGFDTSLGFIPNEIKTGDQGEGDHGLTS